MPPRSSIRARARDDDTADQVFFGATVTVRDARGAERTISIVGVDEIDTARGYISWISPMARALLKAREGDTVIAAHAGGAEELDVVARPLPAARDRRVAGRVDAARAQRLEWPHEFTDSAVPREGLPMPPRGRPR